MSASNLVKELTVDQLRWRCDPSSLKWKSSKDVKPADVIIGQNRAVEAIRLGLEVKREGYNIFISGMAGTGRTTTVKHLLEEIASGDSPPADIVYLHNFRDEDQPRAIFLPAGNGCKFKKSMDRLVNDLKQNLTNLFESDKYQEHRKNIVRSFQNKQKEILQAFESEIAEHSFALVQVQIGQYVKPDLHPLVDEKPMSFDELEVLVREGKVPEEKLKQFEAKYAELESRLHDVFKENRDVVSKLEESLRGLEQKRTEPIVNGLVAYMKSEYDSEDLHIYLAEVAEDVLRNISLFTQERSSNNDSDESQQKNKPDPFIKYRINVLVDNSKTKKPPIVIEINPTYRNLFGIIEREQENMRSHRTDFTKIKAGSLLKASGGFLVINATDALIEPGVWPALKRALRNRKVEIQSYDPFYML